MVCLIQHGYRTVRALVFLSVLLGSVSVQASYLNRKAEGWHWYEDLQPLDKSPKQSEPKKEAVPQTATEILEAFKKEAQRRLHQALVVPTRANVKAYMEIQNAMMERSEIFSKRWMEVVYTTPALDYTVKHPVNQAARHVYIDQAKHQMADKIRQLSQSYGLFFFFKAGCPYCHKFAPIVKRFSQKYGWQVLAIGVDGSTLPEFPEAQPDNGAARRLNIETVPTLLAVNPETGQVVPLSFGMSTEDTIEDRVRVLVQTGKEGDQWKD